MITRFSRAYKILPICSRRSLHQKPNRGIGSFFTRVGSSSLRDLDTFQEGFTSLSKENFQKRNPFSLFSTGTSISSLSSASLDSSLTSSPERYKVNSILYPTKENEEKWKDSTISKTEKLVTIKGWVRTIRDQKSFAFIEVNDGSSMKGLQIVMDVEEIGGKDIYNNLVSQISTGCSIAVEGYVKESPGSGQMFEVQAEKIQVIGPCIGDSYPLQKKRHTLEFLRGIAHLRPRTNTIAAVARVRSKLAMATHKFFQDQGFVYLQSPILTASDCEGAGEMFRVTTFPNDISKIPRKTRKYKDEETGKTKKEKTFEIDYTKDFFGAPAFLTVSGQLSAESYACALGDVYTFGPTFRAENSQTTRHLAEFNMIEPEMAFCDLRENMANAEAYVKYTAKFILENNQQDLEFFSNFYDKELLTKLNRLVNEPFARIEYSEAIKLLQNEIAKDSSLWKYPDVEFGTDLQTEHERWLCEKHFNTATFVYNYPRTIKAFYMRDNDDGKTVAAMDLLVPGVGELIGGSQREERLDVLEKKIEEFGLDKEAYWWYLDLRKYGSVPHSGYGLGFERLVCYCTGVENIRDAVAFPRYPGHAEF